MDTQASEDIKPFEKVNPELPEGVSMAMITNITTNSVELTMTGKNENNVNVGGDMIGSAVAGSLSGFTASQFSVGSNGEAQALQIQSINELIKLLKENNDLSPDASKKSIRHLENAQEVLENAKPSEPEVKKYLSKALDALDVISKGSKLYGKLIPIFNTLGLSL